MNSWLLTLFKEADINPVVSNMFSIITIIGILGALYWATVTALFTAKISIYSEKIQELYIKKSQFKKSIFFVTLFIIGSILLYFLCETRIIQYNNFIFSIWVILAIMLVGYFAYITSQALKYSNLFIISKDIQKDLHNHNKRIISKKYFNSNYWKKTNNRLESNLINFFEIIKTLITRHNLKEQDIMELISENFLIIAHYVNIKNKIPYSLLYVKPFLKFIPLYKSSYNLSISIEISKETFSYEDMIFNFNYMFFEYLLKNKKLNEVHLYLTKLKDLISSNNNELSIYYYITIIDFHLNFFIIFQNEKTKQLSHYENIILLSAIIENYAELLKNSYIIIEKNLSTSPTNIKKYLSNHLIIEYYEKLYKNYDKLDITSIKKEIIEEKNNLITMLIQHIVKISKNLKKINETQWLNNEENEIILYTLKLTELQIINEYDTLKRIIKQSNNNLLKKTINKILPKELDHQLLLNISMYCYNILIQDITLFRTKQLPDLLGHTYITYIKLILQSILLDNLNTFELLLRYFLEVSMKYLNFIRQYSNPEYNDYIQEYYNNTYITTVIFLYALKFFTDKKELKNFITLCKQLIKDVVIEYQKQDALFEHTKKNNSFNNILKDMRITPLEDYEKQKYYMLLNNLIN